MKPSLASQTKKSHKSHKASSKLTYDVKPLIRMAMINKKSAEFCSKTLTLVELTNSRHHKIKMQMNERLENGSVNSLVDDLIAEKLYLHPKVRKFLGKYLVNEAEVKPDMRRNVS